MLMYVNKFNWHAVPEREKKRHKNPAEPVWSPTMAGGLFSIDRAFFERIGTYDSGFDIWGGENLELSFKTWMSLRSFEDEVASDRKKRLFRSSSETSTGRLHDELSKGEDYSGE